MAKMINNQKVQLNEVKCGSSAATLFDNDIMPTIASISDHVGTIKLSVLEKTLIDTMATIGCSATLAQSVPWCGGLPDLKAVSPEFEEMTEYASNALIESGLRILDADDGLDFDLSDDAKLRQTSVSGSPSTVLRVYRKSSGVLLRVVLHLRGLQVALPLDDTSSLSERELDGVVWVLLGVYEDVSELTDDEIAERMDRIEDVADDVRTKLALALAATDAPVSQEHSDDDALVFAIDPEWM
eukprot:TRINITY_DN11254_c0_g4_i1.p1 TRINITY_DN11254_c0_g4~~TRINITY_DN11254_c0_g4_i1.p1  ORF type:complete len:267 (+),score=58.67 TRINITY_DN11254_c0_g4_i1:79-801(+)